MDRLKMPMRDPNSYHKDTTLKWDHIPIERHWSISMRLHDALGHTEPWEICEDRNCDILAVQIICDLFDQPDD